MVDLLSNLIKNVRNFGIETVFRRYYSIYRAQVISNEDLDKRGRIKVKVPNLFGDKELPSLVEPKDFRGTSKGRGEFFPPNIGDWVYVEFENGDQRFPVYSGGWLGKSELDPIFIHDAKNQPVSRGFKNKFGSYWVFSEESGKEKVKLFLKENNYIEVNGESGKEVITIKQGENTIVMNKDGLTINSSEKATIVTKGDISVTSGGKANIKTTGDTALESGGKLTVKSTGETSVTSGGKLTVKATGDANVEASGKVIVKGANVEVKGSAGTKVGDPGSPTEVNGAIVKLAMGSQPVAIVSSQCIGIGNLGGPVISTVISGSPKVFA